MASISRSGLLTSSRGLFSAGGGVGGVACWKEVAGKDFECGLHVFSEEEDAALKNGVWGSGGWSVWWWDGVARMGIWHTTGILVAWPEKIEAFTQSRIQRKFNQSERRRPRVELSSVEATTWLNGTPKSAARRNKDGHPASDEIA